MHVRMNFLLFEKEIERKQGYGIMIINFRRADKIRDTMNIHNSNLTNN